MKKCRYGGLVLIALFLPCILSAATNTSFDGDSYIQYKIRDRPEENRKDKVTLRFKTTNAYGVLLYSCGLEGDFFMLEIKRGRLVYTGSFGSQDDDQSGIHGIIHSVQHNDNRWHQVTILRESGIIELTIDGTTTSKTTKGDFQQLNLDTSIFVGGMGPDERLDTTCLNNLGRTKNFSGCLDDVKFNSIGLLYGANEKFTGYTIHGHLPFTCHQEKIEIMGFNTETSVMQVKRNILTKNELNIYIEFRTFEPTGHILTHKSTDGSVSLDLIDGKIRMMLSFLLLAANDAVKIESEVKIDDGGWHTLEVIVNRNQSQVSLNVDAKKNKYKFGSHFKLATEFGLFTSLVQFGGNTPKLPGLVTCYRKIKIGGKTITSKSGDIISKRKIGSTCQIKDLCFPNPCYHGSKCSQSRGKYTCDCTGTEYSGPRCESCNHKRTCGEWLASGQTKSGMYKLCPNNERIFSVYCNMESGATVLKHNMENDTLVGNDNILGTTGMKFYYHDVTYDVMADDVVDLMNVSLKCQQYIRFDCYQSYLLYGVGRRRHLHYKGTRWLSRDYIIQHYWGGATPNSRKCGCAMDGTCAKDSNGNIKDCNCDVGDRSWRFDAGYLTDKNTLPVSQLQFSIGPETNKDSFFTVGYLNCYGTVPKPTDVPTFTPTVAGEIIHPTLIDGHMFINTSEGLIPYNGTVSPNIVVEGISSETMGALFSKPWLVTIVVIGAILCLLLVFMVFLLFRNNIYDVVVKCIYGNNVSKPRVEIEDYNRYSTATEEESDWDIYRLSTTFPTSTPEPSYGPTDDESVTMRVRTLEDLRGKRRFKRLNGWGSRTASAPTVVGSLSKHSLAEAEEDSLCLPNVEAKRPSSQHSTKTENNIYESADTEPAYSTTATDGECDSVIDDTNSEFSHKSSHHSHNSSMKESECSTTPTRSIASTEKGSPPEVKSSETDRPWKLSCNGDNNYIKVNGIQLPSKINGSKVYATDPVKAYYPVLPLNGYRQPAVRRAHPIEYGPHVAMVNNNGVRCPRLVAVNRRPASSNETYPTVMKHPTIQERDELSDEEMVTYENQRNSDGFYELYDHGDNGSPSSETRLLFDDVSSREECVREADEQIKLLKKKVIEKATSADECV